MKKFLMLAAVLCAAPLHAQNARDETSGPSPAPAPSGRFGNTNVAGISIKGLNREEAMRRLRRELAPRLNASVALTDGRIYFKRRRADFGIELDLGKMLARAGTGAAFVPLALRVDEKQFTAVLRRIEGRFALAPRPARPYLFAGKVRIQRETPWQRLNIGASVPRVAAELQRNAAAKALTLTVERHDPDLTAARLRGIDAVIGTFTTRFNPGLVGRTTNMRTAIAQIDGTLVGSGETFSLNKTVGERTVARGYREAIIFEEGKKKKGLGGGVSQVTGTLFNAALLAGVTIVT